MSYRHFGRIGDIWKHIPLCEFLIIEQPANYIETNSAYPEYQLTASFEQQYGILHVEKNIQKSQLLQQSAYWRVLSSISEKKSGLSKYLGSPALALNILKGTAKNFVFFDIEQACLKEIAEYAKKLNIAQQVNCRNEDSINGLISMIENLTPHDFIHVDPYLIHEKNANGNSYFDAFVRAMRQGIMGMLWYGFNTFQERENLHNGFQKQTGIGSRTRLQGIELRSILLDESILDVNPGVLGCGILIGNLSNISQQYFKEIALEITNIYQNSTMFGKYPGQLIFDEFEIEI
ncbi:hypothetical protein FACHB389_14265 [Nostoc calcicola FACHB-389]|nr:hypothetical protein [Nostoc calcicola FACHB-3891]OKH34810.1 hypothetical protein FACHB389_14265 [Nostoc calcicola FACHB-389]